MRPSHIKSYAGTSKELKKGPDVTTSKQSLARTLAPTFLLFFYLLAETKDQTKPGHAGSNRASTKATGTVLRHEKHKHCDAKC